MKKLFLFIMVFVFSNAFAYCQRCILVNQTRVFDKSYNLVCDYECDDDSSRVRYIDGAYCPAEISCGGGNVF
jgi:hypothetical protein